MGNKQPLQKESEGQSWEQFDQSTAAQRQAGLRAQEAPRLETSGSIEKSENTLKAIPVRFDLNTHTMKVTADETTANLFFVDFQLSTEVPIQLTVSFCNHLVCDQTKHMIQKIVPKYPEDAQLLNFEPGKDLHPPKNFIKFDLSKYTLDEIFTPKQDKLPLVIDVHALDKSNKSQITRMVYLACFHRADFSINACGKRSQL